MQDVENGPQKLKFRPNGRFRKNWRVRPSATDSKLIPVKFLSNFGGASATRSFGGLKDVQFSPLRSSHGDHRRVDIPASQSIALAFPCQSSFSIAMTSHASLESALNAVPNGSQVVYIVSSGPANTLPDHLMPPSTQLAIVGSTKSNNKRSRSSRASQHVPDPATSSEFSLTKISASWTPFQIEIFLDKLLEIANDGGADDGGFKEPQLLQAGEAIREVAGVQYNHTQLRTKWDWAKARWQCIAFLRNASGVGFDDELKQFEAEDEVWEALIEKDKRLAKFRNTPIEYYDVLSQIFHTISCGATGVNAQTAEAKGIKAREPAVNNYPKRQRSGRMATFEAIIHLASILADPKKDNLLECEELLEQWASRPDEMRHGITIETLDAASEDFAENDRLARSFVCKKEKAQLRWLKKKQLQMMEAGEQQRYRRRRSSSAGSSD